MVLKKLTKPVALSCLMPLMLTAQLANAEDKMHHKDHLYFVTVKGGFDQAVNLGSILSGSSVDNTYVAGLEVGKKFKERFAVSLEYSHRGNSTASVATSATNTESWAVKSDSLMVNLSADLMEHGKVIPYVKAGIGMSRNNAGNYVEKGFDAPPTQSTYPGTTSSKFAWQVGAGLTIAGNERVDAQIEYMFVDRGKITTVAGYYSIGNTATLTLDPAKTAALKDHVVTIGFKIKF